MVKLRIIFCLIFAVSMIGFAIAEPNLGQCEMTYAKAANVDATKLLVKKFNFSEAEVAILLTIEKYNQTILDLLIGYSQLINRERVKGNVFEDLARALKMPDYHEKNTDDEQAALMISLPAADLWPVDLNAIVQKTRLINDILKNRDVLISRPAFELLVAVISQYNFHEEYAPAFSPIYLQARKTDYLLDLTDKQRGDYFTAQIFSFPKSIRAKVISLVEAHKMLLLNNFASTRRGRLMTPIVKDLQLGGAFKILAENLILLERAVNAKNENDFSKYMLEYFGKFRKCADDPMLTSLIIIDSNLQNYLKTMNLEPRSWKEWSNFYDLEVRPLELATIAKEGGRSSEIFFAAEKDYFMRLVKPVNIGNIDGKSLHGEIEKLLGKKLRELKKIAQFELDFAKLKSEEIPNSLLDVQLFDFEISENQVTYLSPELQKSGLDASIIAKDAKVMSNLISSYGVNKKIGKEIAQHFLIRDEKYRRIFLKTFIKLIEGKGTLVPFGSKPLNTTSGEIYEFNRLGSYRLFFAFHNHQVVLLLVDHVKDGQTLATQQRAIEISAERFKVHKEAGDAWIKNSSGN